MDCGYPGQVDEIEEAARQAGLSLGSATRLIVTHLDMDHMGSLAELKRLYPGIEIIAHEDEKRYIEGKERSLHLVQAEETLASLTDEAKAGAEQFIAFLRGIQPVSDRSARLLSWRRISRRCLGGTAGACPGLCLLIRVALA